MEPISTEENILPFRGRRCWSDTEKLTILEEAETSGSSISATAKRHKVSPSLLFQWRKQFGENSKDVGSITRHTDPLELIQQRVRLLDRLLKLEQLIIRTLATEVSRKDDDAYQQACAFSAIVTAHAKLMAEREALFERLKSLPTPEVRLTAEEEEFERQKELVAEKLLVEFVKEHCLPPEATASPSNRPPCAS